MSNLRLVFVSLVSLLSASAVIAADPLTLYVTFDEEVAQKVIQAYEKETKTKVNFVRLSTGEATARIAAEKNNPQASLWLGGAAIAHAEIKHKGLSVPYASAATAKLPARFKDKDGNWNGLYVGLLAFVTHSGQIKKLGLKSPKTWDDLTAPGLKGHIQIANPGTSGTSYNLITTLISRSNEAEAFAYLKRLHPNVSQYTRSGEAPTKSAALGETAVAVGYAHDAQRMIHSSKAPLEVTIPTDGTGYEIAAVSLIKGGKQSAEAGKLIDWLYSKAAGQIMADHFLAVILNEGIKAQKSAIDVKSKAIKLIDVDPDWAGKNKARLIEQWNDEINH
jgi:iron(III) transport system substrate-binding protein